MVPGETRTIVLSRDDESQYAICRRPAARDE